MWSNAENKYHRSSTLLTDISNIISRYFSSLCTQTVILCYYTNLKHKTVWQQKIQKGSDVNGGIIKQSN